MNLFDQRALRLLSTKKVPDEIIEQALEIAGTGQHVTEEIAKNLILQITPQKEVKKEKAQIDKAHDIYCSLDENELIKEIINIMYDKNITIKKLESMLEFMQIGEPSQ